MAVELWRGLPFYIVTFLAALQSVPREMIEAGDIDGTNRLQSLFYIVFPNMKPVLTFCLVMATIWALQLFDSIYVLTRGGPSSASSTIVWSIYENIFFFGRVGRGATMSVVLILLISILTFINLRVTKFQEQGLT
jgi:ABC-type sugar transport system permease subunit